MAVVGSGTRKPVVRYLALSGASLVLVGSMIGCSDGGGTGGEASSSEAPSSAATATQPASTTTMSQTPSASMKESPGAASTPASSPSSTPSSTVSASAVNGQTSAVLAAITTAESGVRGGEVFDVEDETERGQRVWSVKVATADDRQFNLSISQDGSSIVANDEDATPDDDIEKLRSAEITVSDAIATAAEEAKGQGDLSSLEIDTDDSDAVVWQIEFGGDSGTTVLVDAASGDIVDVGPDVG